jgi:hypothetical protein
MHVVTDMDAFASTVWIKPGRSVFETAIVICRGTI